MSRTPFPFHGIFASLGQQQADDEAAALRDGPEERQRQEPGQGQSPFTQQKSAAAKGGGQVAVDIYEQDGYYIIKAPIAGVSLSDLDIEISDNVLTIRGKREQSDPIADDQYYLRECFWGEFSRSVTLPFSIDPKKVKATFNKESILKILIPKEEKVKIVRINEG
jgi:HSP20 family molecular chaperone IbpA